MCFWEGGVLSWAGLGWEVLVDGDQSRVDMNGDFGGDTIRL